ncbi:MAG: hypothetical protein JNN24_15075 [Hyphomicrobium zavarzinii]|jgi:hypothetical protein|uniref:hypothetical protein n=1 Tax=Hyphomicrobium TaxID=81 RepID=UPI00058BEA98|nr:MULTISPECIES: hypothetical protein [Hyphomicrobium]MBL8847087.1 hypothetical protein [Hyphomicrobium zavarzinii]WBT40111.1 hypothetical protein PE058_09570 [Hyphomicrobium sp. DMF-1]HML42611.1 hypothetical protein [Hyphomicrobium zavarzinii]
MITFEDCVALCGFSDEEIRAIAEHEHVPDIVAAALANTLLQQKHGAEVIRHMIVEDVKAAHDRGDYKHVHELLACLKHFLDQHPEAVPAYRPGKGKE